MKACVFGGAGYIGSHMVRELQRGGHDIIVFDDLSTGHREAVPGVRLIEANILDAVTLHRTLREFKPDVVFHFAALSIVADSVREPQRYHRNNVTGSALLMDAMRANDIQRMVFSSSAAVYGAPSGGALDEGHPLQPINPYGASKLAVERLLAAAAPDFGLRSISLRYFNAAGADPAGGIGEAHEPETHLIPNALRATDGGAPLNVFGTDYPTRDGTCSRDYVHVNDLVDAHMLAAEFLVRHEGAHRFNLGSERGCTVREIIDAVGRVTRRPVPHNFSPRREGDPPELVANSALARRELGWMPKRSNIDTIVETAWRWHQHRRY